ncbi:hypothetical protein DPMN_052308 [Dreissena polymorpha]|uniref:C-type lectin domain-containing protein n=1 Tax=Dreissena polymorpha TaxID=45954 RepID=A0A9D4CLQ8_DREPO|nr:hypothetical protein DPMN_052308 [Dreissena polymorpha]
MVVLVGKELWINGKKTKDDVWKYLDGTNITVTFWVKGEPNSTGTCLRVVDGGGWRDEYCHRNHGYIFEKSG